MAGDYDRVADQALRHISTALIQQGRVHLASDWNALARHAIERWTTQAHDTFGDKAVPATTANAFSLTAIGGPPLDMSIGAGRCYVDGLQAELYAGETVQGAAVSYLKQPFYPQPPAITGSGLVYLDVWEREITAVEEPLLLDPALEGVDSATRLQTAWQVRLLASASAGGSSFDCTTDLNKQFPPSAGLLSSQAVGPVAPPDPCLLPDQGGYRGIENRLYRVQIHTPGDASTAKWKWSREHASIVGRLLSADTTAKILTLDRIGRDAVLRFNAGDWVEVLNDVYELQGKPGVMARIALPPDETQSTITLDRALPADLLPTDPTLHPRVIRWDQQNGVDANGLLAVTAGWVDLEDGVQVSLELDPGVAGQQFNLGDHWAFAARTPDASVETLVKARPLGPRHHYMALAPYSVSAGGLKISGDCRLPWPPVATTGDDCACTVCVKAEDQQSDPKAIAKAIEKIRKTGGRLCLTAGIFLLAEPLVVEGLQDVIISGQGPATLLLFMSNDVAVTLEAASGVRIQDLSIVAYNVTPTEETTEPIGLLLRNCATVTLERCVVVAANPNRIVKFADIGKPKADDGKVSYTEIFLAGGKFIADKFGCMAVAVEGAVIECTVRDNLLMGDICVGKSMLAASEKTWDGHPMMAIAGFEISSNLMISVVVGAALFDIHEDVVSLFLLETAITGNQILGNGYGGIICDGITDPGASIRVEGNTVETKGAGIAIGMDGAKVAGNTITQIDVELVDTNPPLPGMPGILMFNPYGSKLPFAIAEVTGNRIEGLAGPGIFIDGVFLCLSVSGNSVAAVTGAGIGVSLTSEIGEIAVRDNQVLGVGSPTIGHYEQIAGIAVVKSIDAIVSGNVIGLINNNDAKFDVVGIAILAVETGIVKDNTLSDLGVPGSGDQTTSGILAGPVYADLTIDGNVVRQFSKPADKPGSFIGISVVPFQTVSPQSLSISGNVVEACSHTSLIQVSNVKADLPTGGCIVTANRCRLLNVGLKLAAVAVTADTAVVANNWVQAAGEAAGMRITVPGDKEPNRCTIVGNIVPNGIAVNGQPIQLPWKPLNAIV
jgi:hypothetical protein